MRKLGWVVLALSCLLMMGAEGDCVSGAGDECSSDKECEEHHDEHYCAPCGKCVLTDNAESEAFWCGHGFSRSYASDDSVDEQCGEYSDRGIYDGQAKPFCQKAYADTCTGAPVEVTCSILKDLSSELHDKCPYCDPY